MTIKTITGTVITGGYTLSSAYSALSITSSGTIIGAIGAAGGDDAGGLGGAGLTSRFGATVDNAGVITGGIGGVGASGYNGGAGGAGFYAGEYTTPSIVTNNGVITGGRGGTAGLSARGGSGGVGIRLVGAGGSLANLGLVEGGAGGAARSGLTGATGAGVTLQGVGAWTIVNGSKSARTATIAGAEGVRAAYAAGVTLTNYGTIDGSSGVAVELGSTSDRLIAVSGGKFVGDVDGGGATLELTKATGTITLADRGVYLSDVSGLFNNFGSYVIDAGGRWTLAGDKITAVTLLTLTNFGTLDGPITLGSSSASLVVESDSKITGAVDGVGGGLVLAAATGTISGVGGTGTISGLETMSFNGFGSYRIDTGASWTMTGSNTIGYGHPLKVYGTLNNRGGTISGFATSYPGALVAIYAQGDLINTGVICSSGPVAEESPTVSDRGGSVSNSGTIIGGQGLSNLRHTAETGSYGLYQVHGVLTNAGVIIGGQGGASPTGSGVEGGNGGFGVRENAFYTGAIMNSGTIIGGQGGAGGSVTTGTGGAGGVGGYGVYFAFGDYLGVIPTLTNTGTILAGAGGTGGAGPIQGATGAVLAGVGVSGGSIINTGVIAGGEAGIDTHGSANVLNQAGGVIRGQYGFRAFNSGAYGNTITNFGTIEGTGGVSVQFVSSSDRLIAEAGSTWTGTAWGGGGALELASGVGTITGLGSTATISGAEAMTFSGFGSYDLDVGTSWMFKGAERVSQGQTLTVGGTMSGPGSLTVAGDATIGAGAVVTVGTLSISGGAVSVDESLTFAGAFSVTAAGTVSIASGDKLTLRGNAVLDGTVAGAGSVAANSGTANGLLIGGTTVFTVSGAMAQAGSVTVGDTTTDAAVLRILNGGVWSLGDNTIKRGAAAADRLEVYGQLIKNAGAASGILGIGILDDGVVEVAVGRMLLGQAVHGTGVLKIDAGATLQARFADSTLTAVFNGAQATLALSEPKVFAAAIGGFALTDEIDLVKIAATGASVDAADQLVIVDGKRTVATLQLTGNYQGATFAVGTDGNGGTDITLENAEDAPPPRTPPPHGFIAAMASLGASPAALHSPVSHSEAWRPALLAPGPTPYVR